MMFKQFLILLATTCVFLFSACSEDSSSPEVQIKAMISAMESAVEQRSLDSVKELVDSDYKDQWNGNRRAALRALMFYFQGHKSIHLLTRVSNIEISDDAKSASVTVYVGMSGHPVEEEALIDLNADLYRFDIELLADGDDWLVSSARWQRARLEDFGL